MKLGVALPLAAGKAPASVAAWGASMLAPPLAGRPVEDGALPEEDPVPEEVGSEELEEVEPEELDALEPDDVLDEPVDELDVEPELWLDDPEDAVCVGGSVLGAPPPPDEQAANARRLKETAKVPARIRIWSSHRPPDEIPSRGI